MTKEPKNKITKKLHYTKKHMTIDSGSLQKEVHERLGVLYNNHHQWLTAVAYNKSKDKQLSQDLVQDLYVYLAEKQNPKVFFNDSFNLLYCYNFLSSRFINYIKRKNKTMAEKLYAELLDASQNKGSAIKKREDTHKMAESNKAFAHFRW